VSALKRRTHGARDIRRQSEDYLLIRCVLALDRHREIGRYPPQLVLFNVGSPVATTGVFYVDGADIDPEVVCRISEAELEVGRNLPELLCISWNQFDVDGVTDAFGKP